MARVERASRARRTALDAAKETKAVVETRRAAVGMLVDEKRRFESDAVDVFDDVLGDSGLADDGGLTSGAMEGGPVTASTEASFSLGSVLGLTGCVVLLCLGGIMMFDLVRNIWSWNKTYSLNSSLIESLLSLFPS